MEGLRGAVRWCSLVLLALLVLTPLAQIVARGVFNVPFAGAEELTRWYLIALTFIAASYVTREGGQIRMEEFQAMLAPGPRWALQVVIEAAGVAFYLVLLVACVTTIGRNFDNQTATLEMPFWLFFAPLAIGSALLAVETAVQLVERVRGHRPAAKSTTLA